MCILCYAFKATCEECGRIFTTFPGFRAHEAAHARKRVKDNLRSRPQVERITTRKRVIVPDNLGYLKTVVTDRDGLAAYNLGAISRFAAVINELRATKKRFSKGAKFTLANLSKPNAPPFSKLKCELPNNQAISLYQLSLACNVHPEDTLSLLVSYGFERLATELREGKPAPAPLDPQSIVTPIVKKLKDKRTPHEEFLDKNFPEAAPPQKVTEVVEFRKPDREKTMVSGVIPKREDEG
jgi:hypothetical protein